MNTHLLTPLGLTMLALSLHAQGVSPVISSGLNEPHGIAADAYDNIYITDGGNGNRIISYSSKGEQRVLAGRAGVAGSDDGIGEAATFSDPHGIVFARGGLFVADYNTQLIRFVNITNGAVVTVAGQVDMYGNLVDGAPDVAQFSLPSGLAADSLGNVYVADFGNGAVRKIDLANNVSTVALGFGGGGHGGPDGIALSDNNHIWVADTFNHVIKLITIVPGVSTNVSVVAGNGTAGYRDSTYSLAAMFDLPRALYWVGGQTGLLVADTGNNTIRNVYYNTNTLNFGVAFITNGFNVPLGMSINNDGAILVADSKNSAIQAIARTPQSAPTITPPSGSYSNVVIASFSNNVDAAYSPVFRYTTNGSQPIQSSTAGTNVTISSGQVSLQVRCYAPDLATSANVSNLYTFFVDAPVIYPAGASSSNPIDLTLSTATLGAELRYTTDGSEPTATSRLYSSITLDSNCVVKVKGFRPGYTPSVTVSNVFSFFVADPVIAPAGATNNNTVLVAFSTATATNVSFYWTIDGTTPSATNGHLYTNAFALATNGLLQVVGVKTNYNSSSVVSADFNLTVAAPAIRPSGATNNAGAYLQLTSATTNAVIYWTIDGTEPALTNGYLYVPNTPLQVSGTLKAKAFLDGFVPSQSSSASFSFFVADPVITPNGATNDNPVEVAIHSATPLVDFYWTIDGSEPSRTNGTLYVAPSFVLRTNGVLKVKGFRDGFTPTATASAVFSLGVGPLQVSPDSTLSVNSNTVTVASSTTNAIFLYTFNGSIPSATNGFKYTNSDPSTPLSLTFVTNTILTVSASYPGFVPAATVVKEYQIQVDPPVMTPSGGYFPSGSMVSFAVDRSDATSYYTVNGQDPTTNDLVYTAPFLVDQVSFPLSDLRIIKVRAFAPNTVPSIVVTGQSFATNSVGVPRSLAGGAGATLVVPVVVNLASTQELRSLQFRLEVVPPTSSANMSNDIEALNLSANDFVPVAVNSANGYSAIINWSTYRLTNSGLVTAGIEFHSIATNLLIKKFGVIANVKIKVPATAPLGSNYMIRVLEVSGTSDAAQTKLLLTNLPDATLTVKSTAYLAGDCASGSWYNAGDFGDKNLDNADVNAVFEASLGVHKPYAFTDAYNAMDVYPETRAIIGDGLITYLDWQHVLWRSLRLETNNWIRWWSATGTLSHSNAFGPTLPSGLRTSLTASLATNSNEWVRHAMIVAGTLTNLEPGGSYSLPVYVKMLPGFTMAGLQFRASLTPEGNAPAAGAISFTQAGDIPAPMTRLLLATNELGCAWSLGALPKPLQGSNLLGYLNFHVPSTAQAGQSYSVHLLFPGGAANYDEELVLESVSGAAWVRSAPADAATHLVSDQWKTNYFGSLTSAEAAGEADPDHDGVPNWMEFLAGTNPTNGLSHLAFSGAEWQPGLGLGLRWELVTGRVYVIESSPALNGGKWTPVSTNTIADGTMGAYISPSQTGGAQFYRIRLQQP